MTRFERLHSLTRHLPGEPESWQSYDRLPAGEVVESLESIPNALLVLSGSDAVQPRSKVGIWNFAVVDMSFSQCHRGKTACSAKI